VIDELRYIRSLGIRDVFFVDQSFGSNPERNFELCQAIRTELPGLRWICFSRVDLMDGKTLDNMKKAGCHTIILGVETANEQMLVQYRKGYTLDQIRAVFAEAGN